MELRAKHQIRIEGADKTQAATLAIEFWTSKGFQVHSDSYNCIVFHRHGYGTVGRFFGSVLEQFVGREETPFDQLPVELTVLCQVLPKEAKWDLEFKLEYGVNETTPEAFSRETKFWCDEFAAFCREWMNNV